MLSNLQHKQYNVLFRQYLLDFKEEIYSLHADDERRQEIETFNFPFKSISEYFSIVGCVNGLVCLWDKDSNTLIYWNPSIRKCYMIPKFELEQPIRKKKRLRFIRPASIVRDMCFGFGYDALFNDYKVVRIIFYNKVIDESNDFVFKSSVGVFSLRRKSWRRIDYSAPLALYSRSCNVGGFVYRLTQIENHGFEIVSFNLSSEVFSKIGCPDDVKSVLRCKTELTIFRDSLALMHEWDCKRYHIWVMGEGVEAKLWMKLFSVDLDGRAMGLRIVGFSMKGLMLVVGEGDVLVTPVVEDAQVVKYVPPCPQTAWHVESYKESLVLLKEGDNLPLPLPNFDNAEQLENELGEH